MNLFIGCSSRDEIPSKYLNDCKEYIDSLLEENDLVFGACDTSIMGYAFNKAKSNGRKTYAVSHIKWEEDFKNIDADVKYLVSTVGDRAAKLLDLSDALIFLPGGIGTIHEIFTALESIRSGDFKKPIIIYNSLGYYNGLLTFLNKMYKEEFAEGLDRDIYYVSSNARDTLSYIENYK